MIIDDENPSPEYVKAFNAGYLMAQHEKGLVDQVTPALGNFEQSKAFKAGVEEYQKEKSKDILPGWMKGDRLTKLDSNSPTQDKDTNTPEKT